MKIVSVNVSSPLQIVDQRGKSISTGIFKLPMSGPIRIGSANMEGDGQGDLVHHGGVDKAVYIYPAEYYPIWREELQRPDLDWGHFGENLTIEGLLETEVAIGDKIQVQDAVLEVCQPRIPCFKMGIKMDDEHFPKRMLSSKRSGFYVRVLQEGYVQAGDNYTHIPTPSQSVTIHHLYRMLFDDSENVETIRSAIEFDELAQEWKELLQRKLEHMKRTRSD
jgi:MOSC domain-containing protein YiiM